MTRNWTAPPKNQPSGQPVCSRPAPQRRLSSGQASATSAPPTDHSPPTPKPARKRNSASRYTFGATADNKVKMEYRPIDSINARGRPIRSASHPKTIEQPQPTMNSANNRPPQRPTSATPAAYPERGSSSRSAGTRTWEYRLASMESRIHPPQAAMNAARCSWVKSRKSAGIMCMKGER
jgi:hypothetical protein